MSNDCTDVPPNTAHLGLAKSGGIRKPATKGGNYNLISYFWDLKVDAGVGGGGRLYKDPVLAENMTREHGAV